MRERVLLFGDAAARPDGLERALVRSGFALAEGPAVGPSATPDLALVAVHDAGPALERALAGFQGDGWSEVPVVVLLGSAERDGIARALALGAADAMAAPIDLGELCARLEARLRARAEVRRAAGTGSLQSELFLAVEEIASARRPEEMLETLVRRLGQALGAAHCACLTPSADRRNARLVAVHENPTLRDVQVDLARYPEAVEAMVSGRSVHAAEVLRHPLFLSHLASWPDSPEVHEIESAAAVPLVAHRTVRAIMVLRTRRGEPMLGADQVRLIEQLVSATATLLEREDRRSAVAARRQPVAGSIDPLTGCASLDAFDRRLREEFERARRYDSEFAFALLDIDALRAVNDRHGTAAGDRLLSELGHLFQQEVRIPDFLARYGGDEFAILMPATNLAGARRVLERLGKAVTEHPFKGIAESERPRFAAGLVGFPHPGVSRVEDLLALAEAALLRGKQNHEGEIGIALAGAA
ncbi:MAG: GGDEF domain-containing protein [Gemmatimonadales bacterium]